jgi:ABC-type glycerol-3-phosphate transport system substrate-binding protein
MRARGTVVALIAVTFALAGCAAPSAENMPSSPPTVEVTTAPQDVPGSTLPASEVDAEPAEGLVLAVVASADPGEQEQVALDAVQAFAAEHGGSATVFDHAPADESVAAALLSEPDVIVGIGPEGVGAIDLASASNLDRSFLLLGVELEEPTGNVVAVVWPGAADRAVFTSESPMAFEGAETYAASAIETGLAAFASGLAGHVIALD